MKKFHVIGLQRSGTNWVRELILKNFEGIEENVTFWKHMTPLGVKPEETIKYPHKSGELELQSDTLYLAVVKPFEMWKDSVNFRRVDFDRTHNIAGRGDFTAVYSAWNDWKENQIGKFNFMVVRYEDWYLNWEEGLENVRLKTGWKKALSSYENIQGTVDQSPHWAKEIEIIEKYI